MVLGQLQVALADLLRTADEPTRTASEVERAFGVDYKLAWQVHRLATIKNPLAAGSNVPARVSIQKLLSAATRGGSPRAAVEGVKSAFNAFERMLEEEAADRAELDSMLAAYVPETREKYELEAKRAAFKGLSQVKGVTLDAQVGAFLLVPSKDGAKVDRVTFSAYVGLRRLREQAAIGFGTVSATTPGSAVRTLDGHEPDGLHSILLSQFCSQPVPSFEVSRYETQTRYSVSGSHVGLRSAVNLVMAELRPGAMTRYREPGGRTMSGIMNLPDMPMKRQTTDIFLHADVYQESLPQFAAYDTVPRGMATALDDPARADDRIHFEETIRPIIGGIERAGLAHLPRYVEMLNHVCERLGWSARDFRGFRLDVQYPVYGGQYMVGFNLPEPPR